MFKEAEKEEFLKNEPGAAKFFHPWLGADEFLKGKTRWVLWLGEASEAELDSLPKCREIIEKVRIYRLSSNRAQTRKAAETPAHFGTEIIATEPAVVIPEVSSESRVYVPIGFVSPDVFCSNKVRLLPNAELYHFGVLSSIVHNAWIRVVAGRLESRYNYSNAIVYNNFVWPGPTPEQKEHIERCAQLVLDVREQYPDKSLADLYDPDKMPESLRNAHELLDAAVEAAYGVDFGGDEEKIVAHLFKLYAEMTEGES